MFSSDFPDVNTGAISTLASDLENIAYALVDVGFGTENLRDAVIQHEQWTGTASQQWRAVVTERVGDAGLTNDVMGTASSKLSALAADLVAERRTYDGIMQEIVKRMPAFGAFSAFGGPAPSAEVADPEGYQALLRSVGRANDLLDQAAKDLLGLAILAGDIRAKPAANRTPGVPDGADRKAASLQLLAILFGSVRDNQLSGSEYEDTVLAELGITKNTDVWRPDPAFEGRLTLGGQAKGTTPDGQGTDFLLEIKGTDSQTVRYQLRLEAEYARVSGRPLWIVKRGGNNVTDNLRDLAEGTGGGVIYRTGPNTYTDGNGNPVTVTYDKGSDSLNVSGYTSDANAPSGTDPGAIAPPDPDAPSEPVNPEPPAGGTVPEPVEPVEPVEPIEPIEPIIP